MTRCGCSFGAKPVVAAVLAAWMACGASAQTPPVAPAPEDGRLFGRVTGAEGEPLPHAWLHIETGGRSWSRPADQVGSYDLDLPAGQAHVGVHRIGYTSHRVEVSIPAGGRVELNVTLEPEALQLPGIDVVSEPLRIPEVDDATWAEVQAAPRAVDLVALSLDAGLANVASAALDHAGREPPDGSQVLLMRGSTADLKLLLLDGAPVYTPFHLGGMLDPFDRQVLGGAAHFVGAAPTRYDGGIDYILDLRTRAPAQTTRGVRGALDLASARVSGEWANDDAGVLVSGRALHDLGTRLSHGVDGPYGYFDGLVRGAWRNDALTLGITGFANRESVALGLANVSELPESAEWGNEAVSLRAGHRLGGFDVAWMFAGSVYDARLPLRPDSDVDIDVDDGPVLAEGRTRRTRATLDAVRATGARAIRLGVTLDRTEAAYGSSVNRQDGRTRTDALASGRTWGVHAEVTHPLTRGLTARIGGRLDHFQPGGTMSALRGSVVWEVSPEALLTVAAGRYHQFTGASDQIVEQTLVADPAPSFGSNAPALLGVATGDHVLVGLDQFLTPAVRLGLQAFVKRFTGIPGADAARSSSGVDLRLRGTGPGRDLWLGYALTWSWLDTPGDPGSDRFVGRHIMSAGYRGRLAGPLGLEGRLSFSDGLPLTEVALDATDALAAPEEPPPRVDDQPALTGTADGFVRLDLELFGEWDAPVGGGSVRPYLRVINALDRRDALFYYFEPWRSPDLTPLARQSFLPILGLAWSF